MDGDAGYNRVLDLRNNQSIGLAYCWAHARRKLYEVTHNNVAPIAEEGSSRSRLSTGLKHRRVAHRRMSVWRFAKPKVRARSQSSKHGWTMPVRRYELPPPSRSRGKLLRSSGKFRSARV